LSKPVNPSSLVQELDRVLTKRGQAANPGQAHEEESGKKAGAVGAPGGTT